MNRVLLITLAFAPLLTACVSQPAVRAADVATPPAFEAPTGALPTAQLDRWWAVYGDPELERLVERALANSPDAELAAARLNEAGATRRANYQLVWPTGALTGGGSTSGSRVIDGDLLNFPGFSNSGASQSYNLGFDVSWEVDLFGRVRAGRRLIDADYAATRFNIEGVRVSLSAAVADALFAARGLAQQLADAEEAARIARDLAGVATLRANAGLGSRGDADRAAAEVSRAEASVTDLRGQLQTARRQLLVLIGDGVAPLSSLQILAAPPGAVPPAPAALPGEILQRRPDVREAEARVVAATSQLDLDRLELFPKFTLMPGVGLQRSDQPSFSSTTSNWSIGVNLAVPVLDRPRLMNLIRASGFRAEQAVISYEKVVQTAYGEAENALVMLAADQNRVAILSAGEASARSAYDAARRLYGAGLTDLTTTLSAEQAWRQARTALTAAQVQALRRSVQTFKALGGGWTPTPPGGAA